MDSARPSRVCMVFGLCLWAAAAFAQDAVQGPDSPSSGKTPEVLPEPPTDALDKDQLEFYLRHLYIWPPEFKVEVGDFKPSSISGLLETEVKVSFRLASQVKVFLISEDGKHILDAGRCVFMSSGCDAP